MSQFAYLKFQLANNKIWNIAKAKINPSGHFFQLAKEQAGMKSKYTMASSQSGIWRNEETKYQRQLMGCIAEIYVEEFVKEFLSADSLHGNYFVQRYDNVRTDGFKSPANEYDLKIIERNSKKEFTIETRSSMVYNRGIIKAIEQFDIIGPYSSIAKGEEKYNDFYVRPLFEVMKHEQANYRANDFEKLLCSGSIDLYIAGGCLKKEMAEKGFQKSMQQNNTKYRVVPLIDGYDVIELKNEVIKKILNEK